MYNIVVLKHESNKNNYIWVFKIATMTIKIYNSTSNTTGA